MHRASLLFTTSWRLLEWEEGACPREVLTGWFTVVTYELGLQVGSVGSQLRLRAVRLLAHLVVLRAQRGHGRAEQRHLRLQLHLLRDEQLSRLLVFPQLLPSTTSKLHSAVTKSQQHAGIIGMGSCLESDQLNGSH